MFADGFVTTLATEPEELIIFSPINAFEVTFADEVNSILSNTGSDELSDS